MRFSDAKVLELLRGIDLETVTVPGPLELPLRAAAAERGQASASSAPMPNVLNFLGNKLVGPAAAISSEALHLARMARLAPSHAERARDRGRHFTGDRYRHERSAAEIATLLRKDLHALARQQGPLRGCIFRVSGRGAGTGSINIEVTPPAGVEVINAERAWREARHMGAGGVPRWSEQGQAIITATEAAANRYGYDKSETQSDYTNVAFYLTVGFAGGIEAKTWKAAEEAYAAEQRASRSRPTWDPDPEVNPLPALPAGGLFAVHQGGGVTSVRLKSRPEALVRITGDGSAWSAVGQDRRGERHALGRSLESFDRAFDTGARWLTHQAGGAT